MISSRHRNPIPTKVTMKFLPIFAIALVAFSGVAEINASPVSQSNELHDVFEEFLALVPKEEVVKIFLEYLEKDSQVQEVVQYLEGDGFKELVQKVESIDDVINFYNYLQESGLDVYHLVNKLHEVIGLPPLVPNGAAMSLKMTGGVAGLLADIKAVLPLDDIKALYQEKLKTSPAFAELVKRLGSPRCQELLDALRANEEFRKIVAFAKEAGVDVKAITDLLATIFGLEFTQGRYTLETSGSLIKSKLDDDLQEFVDLLPAKKIRQIATKHYIFDREFRRAIAYVRSEEFYKLVRKLHEIPVYGEFLKSLRNVGLDVESLVKKIHETIKFPEKPLSDDSISPLSIASFITEIKALMPVNDIKFLYVKKLETSPQFVQMIEVLKSQQFQALTNALFADETFTDFLHTLQSHGVNVGVISDFFLKIFGITTPPGIID